MRLKAEVTINIPEHLVVIEKVEYEALQRQTKIGCWWTMEDLEAHTNMGAQWIKKNILYVPKFKKQLEAFVKYPNSQGEKWRFQAIKMAQFLEDNFRTIFDQ